MGTRRAAHALRISLAKSKGILWLIVWVRVQKSGRTEQMPVAIAANHQLGEPVGGDVRSGWVMRSDERRAGFERFPERRDTLLELAHHHVAAVEPQVSESFRRALRQQSRRARLPRIVIRHHRPRRLLVMPIGMTEHNL